MDAVFTLRMLMERHKERQELHCVFIDLEKAYKRVPREELWHCMREAGVPEKCVRTVWDLGDDSVAAARCASGLTEGFRVEGGRRPPPCLVRLTDETKSSVNRDVRRRRHDLPGKPGRGDSWRGGDTHWKEED